MRDGCGCEEGRDGVQKGKFHVRDYERVEKGFVRVEVRERVHVGRGCGQEGESAQQEEGYKSVSVGRRLTYSGDSNYISTNMCVFVHKLISQHLEISAHIVINTRNILFRLPKQHSLLALPNSQQIKFRFRGDLIFPLPSLLIPLFLPLPLLFSPSLPYLYLSPHNPPQAPTA